MPTVEMDFWAVLELIKRGLETGRVEVVLDLINDVLEQSPKNQDRPKCTICTKSITDKDMNQFSIASATGFMFFHKGCFERGAKVNYNV